MEWYAHHIDDYDADTLLLTLAEDGAYRRLLAWYYKHERPLPCEDDHLAAILRISLDEWLKVSPRIKPMFKANGDGRLHHKRCDEELEETSRRRLLNAERQKRGRDKRHA